MTRKYLIKVFVYFILFLENYSVSMYFFRTTQDLFLKNLFHFLGKCWCLKIDFFHDKKEPNSIDLLFIYFKIFGKLQNVSRC